MATIESKFDAAAELLVIVKGGQEWKPRVTQSEIKKALKTLREDSCFEGCEDGDVKDIVELAAMIAAHEWSTLRTATYHPEAYLEAATRSFRKFLKPVRGRGRSTTPIAPTPPKRPTLRLVK